jgi:hypothetical protein
MEQLVEIIVRQVLAELAKRGAEVALPAAAGAGAPPAIEEGSVALDMTGYRTPVLTVDRLRTVDRTVREIIVPAGTVCTIGARDALRQRRVKLTYTVKKP